MAEEVEAELRAMEQAEFERLAADQKDFGLEGVPDDGQNGRVNTLSGWDQRYEGRVIVSYDGEPQACIAHPRLPMPRSGQGGEQGSGHCTRRQRDQGWVVQSAVGEAEVC